MNVAVIEVKKDGRYEDGTGRSREFKAGKYELNPDLAERFAQTNPDTITVVGSEPRKEAPQAPVEASDDNVFS